MESEQNTLSIENNNSNKKKKDKKPMSKKKKITIITACSILGAIILGFVIWFLVLILSPSGTQSLSTVALKVDMDNKYYIGTEGNIDYTKIFPGTTNHKKEGNTLTFKDGIKSVSKEIITIDGAVNVSTFDELVSNINAGKKVVIQNASLVVPKLEGKTEDEIPTMVVKNDVYGNGAVINVNEIVATRTKITDKNGGKLAELTDGTDYKKGTYETGWDAFVIEPTENNAKVVFQDVHVTGNDLSNAEGGNLFGLTAEAIEERGVKLFSGYGSMLNVKGDDKAKANAIIKHCVFENGGKVVHIQSSNVDMEGCIVRNAADTAVSIKTESNYKSVINMKNNVIANSLTGGILFYCMDKNLTNENAADSWNTLNIEGFLDIYNWKEEKGLSFLPETEGESLANIANGIVNSEIPKESYDDLKAQVGDKKYIHFAIIKIRTCDFGQGKSYEVKKNGSNVNGIENIGYTDSKANGQDNGFPIPDAASVVMLDIDVWGYYGNDKGAVGPTDNFDKIDFNKLYKELVEGRK